MKRLSMQALMGLAGLLLAAGSLAPARGGETALDLETFQRIPILHGGRKMPLDSYARQTLLRLSGKSRYETMPASAWLARVLFSSEESFDDKVFLINHPEVPQAVGIEPDENRRYSFRQLQGAIMTLGPLAQKAGALEEKDRSLVDRELLRVYANVSLYFDLYRSFHFALPHEDFRVGNADLKRALNLPPDREDFGFFDIFSSVEKLGPVMEGLVEKDQAQWTEFEVGAYRLSNALFTWSQRYQQLEFALLPSSSHDKEMWVAPWDALALRLRYPALMSAMRNLQKMARAYTDRDAVAFSRAASDYTLYVRSQLGEDPELETIDLEILYNRMKLFFQAKAFYLLGFLLSFLAVISLKSPVRRVALGALLLGLVPHTAGIVIRMMIMGRPPMTNLYATFLFVAWVCVILGLIMERLQRNSLGLLAGTFSGFTLLMVAARFGAEGDTMGKVVAVLDSNFWLSTHVVAITVGYAGCILAGLIGHLYLLYAVFAPGRTQTLAAINRAVFGTLGFGLTFSFLGTMLGGVWADQSWGRFWGWDPKENGALLIVIWCSLLFHARLSRMIGNVGMAAGSVLGIIVVALAWLGVNLLGVGLHSYGFTSGLARGLLVYVAAQVVVVAVLVVWARARARGEAG